MTMLCDVVIAGTLSPIAEGLILVAAQSKGARGQFRSPLGVQTDAGATPSGYTLRNVRLSVCNTQQERESAVIEVTVTPGNKNKSREAGIARDGGFLLTRVKILQIELSGTGLLLGTAELKYFPL